MDIIYNETKKDLPCSQLHTLFVSAGWSDIKTEYLDVFNAPFINSTLVISAWDGERLVGVVRVLSDKIVRSVIHDLVVLPEYKSIGIGKELVRRCMAHFPNSEWLVQTEKHIVPFYEKMGFKKHDAVLTIPSAYDPTRERS